MSLTGAKVLHARFGSGIIEKMEDSYIHVRFEGMEAQKAFVYPDAFQGFLQLENPEFAEAIHAALRDKQMQEADAKAARNERLLKMVQMINAEKTANRVKTKASTARKG